MSLGARGFGLVKGNPKRDPQRQEALPGVLVAPLSAPAAWPPGGPACLTGPHGACRRRCLVGFSVVSRGLHGTSIAQSCGSGVRSRQHL